jgi:hypothetical protein
MTGQFSNFLSKGKQIKETAETAEKERDIAGMSKEERGEKTIIPGLTKVKTPKRSTLGVNTQEVPNVEIDPSSSAREM